MAKLTVDHVFVRVFASVQVVDGEKRIINWAGAFFVINPLS